MKKSKILKILNFLAKAFEVFKRYNPNDLHKRPKSIKMTDPNSLNTNELKNLATLYGVSNEGTKSELIKRIKNQLMGPFKIKTK